MKKRLANFMLLAVFCFLQIQAAVAEDNIQVVVNGEYVHFDQQPILQNGRTLVPLRGIFEKLGATVEWEESSETVTALIPGTKVELTIGSTTARISHPSVEKEEAEAPEEPQKSSIGGSGGSGSGSGTGGIGAISITVPQTVTLDVPAQVVNGRTLVPVRFISESLGAQVGWEEDTQTVIITMELSEEKTAATPTPAQTAEATKAPTATPKPTPKPTPRPTQAPEEEESEGGFIVPELGHEYGPFTLTSYYSSGQYWNSVQVDSLIFSKCELTSIGKYKVAASIQGVSDDRRPWIIARFYDANNRVLGEAEFLPSVPANEEFNVLDDTFVEQDVIENAVSMEFYSYSGEKAQYGNHSNSNSELEEEESTQEPEEEPRPTPKPDDEPEEIENTQYEMYAGYSGIPTFDQFTSGSVSLMDIEDEMKGLLYLVQEDAVQSEIEAFEAALFECGFQENGGGGVQIFSKGERGQSDYREVRISIVAGPAPNTKAVLIDIAKRLPTNEQ